MRGCRIVGTGGYLPERRVSNAEVEVFCDTSDEWIRSRSGVTQRYFCAEGEGTADMAVVAGRMALQNAGLMASEIGLVIVATHYPDYATPSVACEVQAELGITGPAFDLNAACSGFVYGIDNAWRQIATGAVDTALVIGADRLSQVINWDDRATAVLFGDGAGAAVLQLSETAEGIEYSKMYADGSLKDVVFITNGNPPPGKELEPNRIYMRGNELFRHAVTVLSDSLKTAFSDTGKTVDDIDWLIPHQANIRIMNAVAKKIGLPQDKVIVTVDQHANTSAATIPLALDLARRDGRVKRGDTVAFAAVAGGLAWGVTLLTM